MSGRGGVVNLTWDGYVPPESSPNPSILRFAANFSWELAAEPLHRDIDVAKVCGVCPGMAFANSLLKKDSRFGVVGLVPCAIGGTNISEWVRGGDLYNRMMLRAKTASRGGGVIRGLLWYQGESDTVSLEDAEAYEKRLHSFFIDVRSDLHLPLLPIIQVALASGQGPYTAPHHTSSSVSWQDVNQCVSSNLSSPIMKLCVLVCFSRGKLPELKKVESEFCEPCVKCLKSDNGGGDEEPVGASDSGSSDSEEEQSPQSPDQTQNQVALASGQGPYTAPHHTSSSVSWQDVREAQLRTRLVNLRTVDAKGLSLQEPEMLHLTTPAQVSLGKMLTNAFLQTCHPQS
ncbi:hypothetical protein QVD17_16143 [Tagetes erecta]|uniref:Sialate O-acetylesterase domain-containing protein n=1 Tax=Tagetes erecta TaxID=13708 RepID=A0AAD8P091_TARER|nr:hypothetical protein QVD17_16143 [Tagetes erecta]